MARTDTITIPADDWTQLTNADTTAVTFQVKRGTVSLVVTVGAVEPTDFDNAIRYTEGQGEVAIPLADLAPGTDGGTRVYAHSNAASADIYFSHADAA
jgi:hypothetical protein